MTFRFLMIAGVLAAAACGAGEEGRELEYAVNVGEPVVVELGGAVRADTSSLPAGATIAEERLEWTPAADQEGEHVFMLDVLREGSYEPAIVRVSVTPGDASIEYGGCDCGSRPNPPRPKAEAIGALLLAAWFRQKRRAA